MQERLGECGYYKTQINSNYFEKLVDIKLQPLNNQRSQKIHQLQQIHLKNVITENEITIQLKQPKLLTHLYLYEKINFYSLSILII